MSKIDDRVGEDNITKNCSKCNKEKFLHEFRVQSKAKDGYKSYCILCDDIYNKELYKKSKKKRIVQISLWNQKHPDKVKQYKKKWTENNI